tara:strand:- start:51523 stop:52011 length:489 start_codon:yes stop_codon:yes gene_type:complete
MMENKFKISVNDSSEYNFKSSQTQNLDILKLSKSEFHVLQNNKPFQIEIKKQDFSKKEYTIKINSNIYCVKISNQLDVLIKEMGFSLAATKKSNEIKAPMPGLILNLIVKEGQKVKEGDTLLILEAMKMENTITAPKNGIIKSIAVAKGITVEKGELMIIMA